MRLNNKISSSVARGGKGVKMDILLVITNQ